ncbi:hypothetical protein BDW71DRAFT_116082 [Aspergillus fruticulosus]
MNFLRVPIAECPSETEKSTLSVIFGLVADIVLNVLLARCTAPAFRMLPITTLGFPAGP